MGNNEGKSRAKGEGGRRKEEGGRRKEQSNVQCSMSNGVIARSGEVIEGDAAISDTGIASHELRFAMTTRATLVRIQIIKKTAKDVLSS